MNNFIRYFLFSLAFIIVGLIIGLQLTQRLRVNPINPSGDELAKFQQALEFVEKNYVREVDKKKLVEDAIKGMMDGLDPHSFYIPAAEKEEVQEQLEGSFDGIGVQFDIISDTIYVENALPGGPSEKVGILAGDRIVQVDGVNVAGISITTRQVMKYLKGPKYSLVKITVLRKGKGLLNFEVKRDKIPLNSVSFAYMIQPETGYISINRFAENTYREFKEQLINLEEKGMKNLILDLRGNPGGYMDEAYKIADEFLPAGNMIVSTKGRLIQSKQQYEATEKLALFEEGALVVLVNYGSASASEIVAGAIQDHDRGLIIGVRSFGKGMVQIQENFKDGSALRLVISKYYTPSGRSIQKPFDKGADRYEREIYERFQSGEIYDPTKVIFPDSLKFKTHSGRTVYGGGGIFPDIFVADDTTSNSGYLMSLRMKDLFRDFAIYYVDNNIPLLKSYPDAKSFISSFPITETLAAQFIAFATNKGVPFVKSDYEVSKKFIFNQLKAYIGRRLYNDDGFYPVLHNTDNVILKALELIPMAEELKRTGKVALATGN